MTIRIKQYCSNYMEQNLVIYDSNVYNKTLHSENTTYPLWQW